MKHCHCKVQPTALRLYNYNHSTWQHAYRMSNQPSRTHQLPKRYCDSSNESGADSSDTSSLWMDEVLNQKGKEKAKQMKHKRRKKKKGKTHIIEVSSSEEGGIGGDGEVMDVDGIGDKDNVGDRAGDSGDKAIEVSL